jgi:hypothetical protein
VPPQDIKKFVLVTSIGCDDPLFPLNALWGVLLWKKQVRRPNTSKRACLNRSHSRAAPRQPCRLAAAFVHGCCFTSLPVLTPRIYAWPYIGLA